jgi:ABC-type amino acid transport substrate-binding protein
LRDAVGCRPGFIDTIRQKGELVIASDATYGPFEVTNIQREIVGFDANVGAELTRAMG